MTDTVKINGDMSKAIIIIPIWTMENLNVNMIAEEISDITEGVKVLWDKAKEISKDIWEKAEEIDSNVENIEDQTPDVIKILTGELLKALSFKFPPGIALRHRLAISLIETVMSGAICQGCFEKYFARKHFAK